MEYVRTWGWSDGAGQKLKDFVEGCGYFGMKWALRSQLGTRISSSSMLRCPLRAATVGR